MQVCGVKQGPLRETPLAGNPQGALRTSDYRFTWTLKRDGKYPRFAKQIVQYDYAQTKAWVSSYDDSLKNLCVLPGTVRQGRCCALCGESCFCSEVVDGFASNQKINQNKRFSNLASR